MLPLPTPTLLVQAQAIAQCLANGSSTTCWPTTTLSTRAPTT
jgi:hypothetical protein